MKQYLHAANTDWYNQRLAGLMLWVLVAFAVLIIRLFYLQVIEGREFRRLSENNCIRLQSVPPQRGLIYDRNRKLLVDNRPSFDLSIIPKDAHPIKQTLNKLAHLTGIPLKTFETKVSGKKGILAYKSVLLKKDIGRDMLAVIEVHKFDLPGVTVDIRPLRHYITGHCASHLLGYLSEINAEELKNEQYKGYRPGDFIGKFGIEKKYEKALRGERGGRQVEVNVTGQVVRILKTVGAIPGDNIVLTIDEILQKKAENLLKDKAGSVVAMIPATGEILVFASSPSFNQNAFVSGMTHKQWNALVSNPLRPMENKTIQAEYPPASVYKIITAIAGLEEGIIDKNTKVKCQGYYKYGNRNPRCWKKYGHGTVNLVDALAQSCDVFFYQTGHKLGVDKMAEYAKACGLGKHTGINLDHEAQGLVPTKEWKEKRFKSQWLGGETLSVSIGQGSNLVTPLQMLSLISAVANNGTIVKPQVVKSIETIERIVLEKSKIETSKKLPVSAENLELIKKGLWKVVNARKGTAWNIRAKGIDVSGKTGTAQVVSSRQDEDEDEENIPLKLKPHAWFVAYAPTSKPEIAIAVIVEHGGHGSRSAAPIAADIIKTYLAGKESPDKK